MTSQVKQVVEHKSRRRWAAYGFLLIVSLTVIAWFAAPGVISWMKVTFKQFRPVGLTQFQLQLAFAGIVFVVLALIAALVVTLGSPKKPLNVREKDLIKERTDNVTYRRQQRKRQRTLNREMREFVEKNQKK